MELFKTMVKNTALLFTVGIVVALAMPLVASGLNAMGFMTVAAMTHANGATAAAMWTGLVFGGFGAFHTLLQPTFDAVFGDGKEKAAAAPLKEASHCKGHGHGVTITNLQMQPELNIASDVAVDAKANMALGNENNVDNKAKIFTQMLEAQNAKSDPALAGR